MSVVISFQIVSLHWS